MKQFIEIGSQTVLLPIAMATGLGRLVTVQEIKTRYLYAALGQEILLH